MLGQPIRASTEASLDRTLQSATERQREGISVVVSELDTPEDLEVSHHGTLPSVSQAWGEPPIGGIVQSEPEHQLHTPDGFEVLQQGVLRKMANPQKSVHFEDLDPPEAHPSNGCVNLDTHTTMPHQLDMRSISSILASQHEVCQQMMSTNHRQTLELLSYRGEYQRKSRKGKIPQQCGNGEALHRQEGTFSSSSPDVIQQDNSIALALGASPRANPMLEASHSMPYSWLDSGTQQFLDPDTLPFHVTDSIDTHIALAEMHDGIDDELPEGRRTQRWTEWCRFKAIHPYSLKRLVWDMFGGLLIMFDLIVIPLRNFPLSDSGVLPFMEWVSTFYWSADLPRQFLIGYELYGQLETRFEKIAKRYMTTWMFPDVTIVIVDWICIFLATSSSSSRSWRASKAAKALRLLRVVRLSRVFKVPPLLTALLDVVQSVHVLVFTKAFYVFFSIILVVHYVACYWYWLGDVGIFPELCSTNWLQKHKLEHIRAGDAYMLSLHWSLAQSGLSTIHIYPTNVVEQVYACGVMLLWLVMLPGVICFFCAWLEQVKEANQDLLKQEGKIRKYLHLNGTTSALTNHVLRLFRLEYKPGMKRLHLADVPFFKELPTNVRIQLHSQVFSPVLRKHPAFSYCGICNPSEMLAVCHLCMEEHHYAALSTVFQDTEPCHCVRFVTSGNLRYYIGSSTNSVPVEPGSWISEAVLWTPWTHCGHLKVCCSSEIVSIDANRFHSVMEEAALTKTDVTFLKEYSSLFKDTLEQGSTKSDIWPDNVVLLTAVKEIIKSMSDPTRTLSTSTSFAGRGGTIAEGLGHFISKSQLFTRKGGQRGGGRLRKIPTYSW